MKILTKYLPYDNVQFVFNPIKSLVKGVMRKYWLAREVVIIAETFCHMGWGVYIIVML